MEKENNIYNFKLLFIVLLILQFNCINAQIEITGNVFNEIGQPIQGANIILLKNNATKNYTLSNNEGFFILNANKGVYKIKITHLGYKSYIQEFKIDQKDYHFGKITITNDINELKEVIVKAEAKIIKKGDTTVYKTEKFINGTERNLKDVLLSLPDIGINENGKITFQGKQIDKLLVDGENLYKNQHQLATDNLPAEMAGNIEVIKNYKDFEYIGLNDKTGLTALNILVNESFKNRFTGNLDAGVGIVNKYEFKPKIFNFSKQIKSSLISNFNNTGNVPITLQDYNELTNNNPIGENTTNTVKFIDNSDAPSFLTSKDRAKTRLTNFATLSSVYKLNNKTKFDFYTILNNTSQNRIKQNLQTLSASNNNFSFIEENIFNEENWFVLGQLKGVYKNGENSIFKLEQHFNFDHSRNKNFITNQAVDTTIINQNIIPENFITKTKLTFTKKNKNALLNLESYFNLINNNENLLIDANRPILNTVSSIINQEVKNNNKRAGLNIKYDKEFSNFYLSNSVNLSYNHSKIETINNLFQNNNLTLSSYQSRVSSTISFNLNPNIKYSVGLGYNFNLQNFNNVGSELLFFDINTSLKLKISENNYGILSYSYDNETNTIYNLIINPVVRNYRNLSVNNNLNFDNIFPSHQINYQHHIIKSTNFSFVFNSTFRKRRKDIGNNIFNSPNVTVTQYQLINDNDFFSNLFFFEKRFKSLPLTFTNSINIDFVKNQYFEDNNPFEFKKNTIGGFSEVSSNFKNSPIHISLGHRYTYSTFNFNTLKSRLTQRQPYLNLDGIISKNIIWNVESKYSIFETENINSNIFYLNPSIFYKKESSNWEYGIKGFNILNLNNNNLVENNTQQSIINQSITKILQGYLLLNANFSF
ncbi:MAG: hypothetical protein CL596_08370 [Alteromonas sp.]|nr:hypothetical protein [Alteromonas sp.]MAY21901.1 hypothetical protein [Flavobacteriaceae bacterium]|tara:strand:- start:89170 stop:91797 length:2628 start_codon:yes stop_codon:yes gene_type:complete